MLISFEMYNFFYIWSISRQLRENLKIKFGQNLSKFKSVSVSIKQPTLFYSTLFVQEEGKPTFSETVQSKAPHFFASFMN